LTGKAEPAIQLKSSDGKIIMLSGFRGKTRICGILGDVVQLRASI